jgi:gamma-glutamyltranspeptidase
MVAMTTIEDGFGARLMTRRGFLLNNFGDAREHEPVDSRGWADRR